MEVEARRKLVAVEEEEAGVHTARARTLQEECQAELNQALPALHGECLALHHYNYSQIFPGSPQFGLWTTFIVTCQEFKY